MAAFPYFPFYPADWLSSPRNMCSTLVQQGAYIRLLCACWLSDDCSIPNDPKKLAMLSWLPEHELDFVYQMFSDHPRKDGHLTNERLLKEWEKVNRLSVKRSQAGKKSGKVRRTSVQQVLEQKTNKIGTLVTISESESESDSEVRNQKSERRKKKELNTCAVPSAAAMVWTRYADAYQARYKTHPVRNAKVSGQLSQLIKRVGDAAAPEVAAFYVWHNDQFYVRARHPPGLLLRDCEGLHTQWVTGVKATADEAKNLEQRDNRIGQFERVMAKLEVKP